MESNQTQIDQALTHLHSKKVRWATLSIPKRLEILEKSTRDMLAISDQWVAAGLSAKTLPRDSMGEAEEWLYVAAIMRCLRMIRKTLLEIQRNGRPRLPGKVIRTINGQTAVQVFPRDPWDAIVYRGDRAEVWMEPGVTISKADNWYAWQNFPADADGKVALVLGAGNVSFLPVIDLLYRLFVRNQVVVIKLNPVNDYLGPLMEVGLHSLIQPGYLQIIYGGANQGRYLSQHPLVDEMHLTGSIKTFETIVFGSGEEGQQRKARRDPKTSKPFTCELGNVSPLIVVPGPWSKADLQDQAEQVATWFTGNAGFGCLNPRMIVQHTSWSARRPFLDAIVGVLGKIKTRRAYYPKARELLDEFLAAHPEALQIGNPSGDELPWTIVPDLDPSKRDDICFTQEAFCGLMAETGLEAADTVDFIQRAVEFANSTLWGSLCATILVHPASLRDPAVAAALYTAIADLRYGSVTINLAAFYPVYSQVTPWGGYPGNPIHDVQSGIGKTSNTLMFARPQKSVWWGPFRKYPDPLRATARRPATLARKMALFEGSPSLLKIPGLIWSSLVD
jgi:acyl-CoA reductase-like NAD-dependent aldehyde dehydrogenase